MIYADTMALSNHLLKNAIIAFCMMGNRVVKNIGKQGKRKFVIEIINSMKVVSLSFESKHEIHFSSPKEITSNMYRDDKFIHQALSMCMPFATEIFTYLSGRSLTIPIIVRGDLPLEKESGN